jgi:type IV secretion system protein VirB2
MYPSLQGNRSPPPGKQLKDPCQMKTIPKHPSIRFSRRVLVRIALILSAVGAAAPACAQLTKATSTLTAISTWMQGLGVTIITIAVIWAGIKMIFGHQQLKDLGGVFWGSFLIGGASLIASFFFSGTSS